MLKYATTQILGASLAHGGGLLKDAHRHVFEYEPREGFIYVRSRAISSRCNDNFDYFGPDEIAKAYQTFIGKPVFVNHHNSDHKRLRGVIVDAALHEDMNPDGSPDTWAEVLMEIDAVKFPKLAQAILAGHIDRTSMGTDVEYSVCSYCGNRAVTPLDYCNHVAKLKGQRIRRKNASTGEQEDVLIFERCYGLSFFENSLLVEDPADPTAYFLGVDARGIGVTSSKKVAASKMADEPVIEVRDTTLPYSGTRACILTARVGGVLAGDALVLEDDERSGWVLSSIEIPEQYQRQGIATAMLAKAREHLGEVHHDHPDAMTEDGRAWSRVTASKTADGHFDMSGPDPVWVQDHNELLRDALWSWKGDDAAPKTTSLHIGSKQSVLDDALSLIPDADRQLIGAVRVREVDGNGPPAEWDAPSRSINIYGSADPPLSTVVHELGHALDDALGGLSQSGPFKAIAKPYASGYRMHRGYSKEAEVWADGYMALYGGATPMWWPGSGSDLARVIREARVHASTLGKLAIRVTAMAPSEVLNRINSSGGVTVSTHDQTVPHSGFMVSEAGHERVLGSLTPEAVQDYIDANADALRGFQHYLGGWVDSGRIYLDVSDWYGDQDQAVQRGKAAHQLAVWDLAHNSEIRLDGKPNVKRSVMGGWDVQTADGLDVTLELQQGDPMTILAYIDGRDVGAMQISSEGKVYSIRVDDPYRRRGVGTAMMTYARQRFDDVRPWGPVTNDGRAFLDVVGMRKRSMLDQHRLFIGVDPDDYDHHEIHAWMHSKIHGDQSDGSMGMRRSIGSGPRQILGFSGPIWRTKSTGYFHRSIACPHIRGDIVEPWPVSDLREEGLVAQMGSKACTTCFPSAPTKTAAVEVRLRNSGNPLTGEPVWSLWRVADGKLEVSGFTSEDEARAYADEQGLSVTAKTAAVARPANPPKSPFAQHNSDTCANCGKPITYSISMSKGSRWIHDDTYNVRCSKEAKVAGRLADARHEHWPLARTAHMTIESYKVTAALPDQIPAPPEIDTLREETCPICGQGSDDGWNGDECAVCGYIAPPDSFTDPDLDKAKEVDLRQDQQDDQAKPDPYQTPGATPPPDASSGGGIEQYKVAVSG